MLRRARELQGEGKIVGAVSDAVFSFRKENKEESDFQNDFKIKLSWFTYFQIHLFGID